MVFFNICLWSKWLKFPSKSGKNHNYCYYSISLATILITTICCYQFYTKSYKNESRRYSTEKIKLDLVNIPKIVLDSAGDVDELVAVRNVNCSFWDCFNVYRCGQKVHNHDRISIYVYPLKNYQNRDGKPIVLSKEFYMILKTIVDSPYYTSNPNEACLLLPSIDTLNLVTADYELVSQALSSLPK